MLGILSPFESGLKTEWLQSNFNRDKLLLRGSIFLAYGFKFNGLYQELAYLYAATGNSEKVLQCVDSLLLYNQNNFQGDYAACGDNAANIAAVYFLNEKHDQLGAFVSGYCSRKNINEEEFYARLIGRTLHSYNAVGNLELYPWMNNIQNLNLQFSSRNQLSFFFNKYREGVQSIIKDPNQKNFFMALSFKDEGILKSLYKEPPARDELRVKELFDKALSFYNSVNPQFLEQAIQVITSGSDVMNVPRKFLFIYPDLRTSFHPSEPRSFFYFYFSDVFLEYILSNQLFDLFYPGQGELNYLSLWVSDYNSKKIEYPAFLINNPRNTILKNLDQELGKRNVGNLDLNLLYLYLGREAEESGNKEEMLGYYNKIQFNNIFNILRSKEFAGLIRNQSFRLISYALMGYVKTGHFDQAYKLAGMFKNPVNRSSLYAFAAQELLREKVEGKMIQQLIDSAQIELTRVENITGDQPNRRILAYALAMQDPSKNLSKVYMLIKNLPAKFSAIEDISRSFSFYGDLYQAKANIPDFISGSDQADFLWNILYGYSEGKGDAGPAWKEFIQNYPVMLNRFIVYIDENS